MPDKDGNPTHTDWGRLVERIERAAINQGESLKKEEMEDVRKILGFSKVLAEYGSSDLDRVLKWSRAIAGFLTVGKWLIAALAAASMVLASVKGFIPGFGAAALSIPGVTIRFAGRLAICLTRGAGLALASLWLVFYTLAFFWPASAWLDVKSIQIGPGTALADIPMQVDREIDRDVSGSWRVTVRAWYEGIGWVYYCSAEGSANYSAHAKLPSELTLGWWSAGECGILPVGRYVVDTRWILHPTFPIPEKEVYVTSNIFEVKP